MPDKKIIHLFTHGTKQRGANPVMTLKGCADVARLQKYLPKQLVQIWIGEAARHWDVASALGLFKDDESLQLTPKYSSVWGSAGSGEKRGGNEVIVVLPDGREIPYAQCTSGQDGAPSVKAKLLSDDVQHDAVICAGREIVIALGETLETAKSAAYYRITVENGTISHELVAIGTASPLPEGRYSPSKH